MQWIVLIVDDHPLVGEAFELSVGAAYPHLEVGRVTTAAEAETYARANGPRIKLVLLDLMLPDATGFSALIRLQQLLPGQRYQGGLRQQHRSCRDRNRQSLFRTAECVSLSQ